MNTLSRSVSESLCQVFFASSSLSLFDRLGDKRDMRALSEFWITKTILKMSSSVHTLVENIIVSHAVKLD